MYKTPFHPASKDQHPGAMTAGKASSPQAPGSPSVCVDSTELLRGQKTVEISHNGSTYRLQATRLGKLILTK